MEKWSITDVENWLLATKQLSTNSTHPVIGLTGADILELVQDEGALTDIFQGYPSRADGGPSMSVFKIRVRNDKDKEASTYQASNNAPVLSGFTTPSSIGSAGRSTSSASIDSALGAGDNESSSSNVSVTSIVSTLTDMATDTAKGADAADEDNEDTEDDGTSNTTKMQNAIALHVAMYNAVHGTDESLATTAEGESTCDLCSTVMRFAASEGPRTTSRHFVSKKHVDARAKQKKALVQEREHTVGDMHAVLGLPLVRGIKAVSSVSLTPRADNDGHLSGLGCDCGRFLKATTVFMAIGCAQKHTCKGKGTRKRQVKPVDEHTPKKRKTINKKVNEVQDAGSEQEEVEETSGTTTPRRHSTQQTLHQSFALTPTSSSSSSSRHVSSATPSPSSTSPSSTLSAPTGQRVAQPLRSSKKGKGEVGPFFD